MRGHDKVGNTLRYGDKVAFIAPYFSHLRVGTVSKVTPGGVTIEYFKKEGEETVKLSRLSNQVMKVIDEDKFL